MVFDPYRHPPSSPAKRLNFFVRTWKSFQKKKLINSISFKKSNECNSTYYVWLNGRHVGTIVLACKNEFLRTITIQSAYITNFWQRCGILTKFCEMIYKEMKNDGYDLVHPSKEKLVTGAGRAFWESNSFRKT